MIKNIFAIKLLILTGFFTQPSKAQTTSTDPLASLDTLQQQQWVDSVYNSLSWNARIGQLFMVPAYPNGTAKDNKKLRQLVKKYKVGGLIFMQGHQKRQAHLTNQLQSIAKVPLLVGTDLESGFNMQLDSTLNYPMHLTLGAISNDSLIYQMGADIAQQMKTMGVHLNFAPVVNINHKTKNPSGINYRSFGEDKTTVAQKATQYMKGLQDHGVLACAKYFSDPGVPHTTLPVASDSLQQIDAIDFYAFDKLIDNGVASIINIDLPMPTIDTTNNTPGSPSNKTLQNFLENKANFRGLLVMNALNKKDITEIFPFGKSKFIAFQSKNELLLLSENVPGTIKKMRKVIGRDKVKRRNLMSSVKKILMAKYKVGLANYQPINTDNLSRKLHRPESEVLQQKLYQGAITVVNNKEQVLPFQSIDTTSFASLSLSEHAPVFHQALSRYAKFSAFHNGGNKNSQQLMDQLKKFEVVVIGIFGMNNFSAKNYGINEQDITFIETLSQYTKVIVTVFGNPYSLSNFSKLDQVICAYENNKYTQSLIPQALFGAIDVTGVMPISTGDHFSKPISLRNIQRLGFSTPEMVDMGSQKLNQIDLIAKEAIESMATPGCQILVARRGKVVFNKSYGYHTYDSLVSVTSESIYDIASITKVTASLQAIIFLEERGLIDLDKKISFYLTDLKGSNKEHMTIRDILSHQAGLWPYLPFWKQTMNNQEYLPEYYHYKRENEFPYFVSEGLYSSKNIRENVWKWVIESKVRDKKKDIPYGYKYSDMGYYMMHRLVESILNQPIEDFLSQNIYAPLGLTTLGYNPLDQFSKNHITPTENDFTFRMSQVWGTVHDQGAALFGGVAGHAGLFSNARDLATLMQMHLQGGLYGGQRYFRQTTLDKFNTQQYHNYNRRGAGWDKPLIGAWYGPTSEYASSKTYGHTGFTGTAVWVDPTFNLIFVFLSNRIYPDASNRKLINNNIRTRIQDLIYQSIWEYNK